MSLSVVMQVLKLELKQIRDQQDLLFRFMNFLKQEGAVHVLQFCLAVGKKMETLHDTSCLLLFHIGGLCMLQEEMLARS